MRWTGQGLTSRTTHADPLQPLAPRAFPPSQHPPLFSRTTQVSISDFLTLFSARSLDNFFWSTRPAPILLGAGTVALFISTMLAAFWPEAHADDTLIIGLARRPPKLMILYVWVYCILCWFVQVRDCCPRGIWWSLAPEWRS